MKYGNYPMLNLEKNLEEYMTGLVYALITRAY